jgi:hypothetical protein
MSRYLNSSAIDALRRSSRCQSDGEAGSEAGCQEFLHWVLPLWTPESNRSAGTIVPRNWPPLQRNRSDNRNGTSRRYPVGLPRGALADEIDHRAAMDHAGEVEGVPIREPDAAM